MGARLLIVDDHAVLAEAVGAALNGRGFDVRVLVPSELGLDEVLQTTQAHRASVVVLDLYLGADQLGLNYIAPLREAGASVLILTTSQDPVLRGECLLAGAAAVVDKASPFDELVASIEAVAEGRPAMSIARREVLLQERRAALAAASNRLDRFDALTRREQQVLMLLVEGRTVKEAARDSGVSVATVRTQIRSILEKLGARSMRDAVVEAVKAGWPADR